MPSYVEATLENLYDKSHPVNQVGSASVINGVITRDRWNQPATVRIVDHPADVSEEEPALFTNRFVLDSWRLSKAKLGTATVLTQVSGVDLVIPGTNIFVPLPQFSPVTGFQLLANGTTSQTLTWNLIGAEVQQYRIDRERVGIDSDYSVLATYSNITREAVVTGLSPDQTVRYRIRAEAPGWTPGDWTYLNTVTLMEEVETEVSPPGNFIVENVSQGVQHLSWTYGSDPIDSFTLEYLRQGVDSDFVLLAGDISPTVRETDVSGLPDDTLVQYRIRAGSGVLLSAWRSTSLTTEPAVPLDVPVWTGDLPNEEILYETLPASTTYDNTVLNSSTDIISARILPVVPGVTVTNSTTSVTLTFETDIVPTKQLIKVYATNSEGESLASNVINVYIDDTTNPDPALPEPPLPRESPIETSTFTGNAPGSGLIAPFWQEFSSGWEYKATEETQYGNVAVGLVPTLEVTTALIDQALAPDHYIELALDKLLVDPNHVIGAFIRGDVFNNTFYYGMVNYDYVSIYYADATGNYLLGQTDRGSYIPAIGDILTFAARGNILELYINDILILAYEDTRSAPNPGYAGLVGYGVPDSGWFSAITYGVASRPGTIPYTAWPQEVALSDITFNTMRISWGYDSANTAVSFDVDRLQQGVDSNWVRIATGLASGVREFTASGLTTDTDVSLRIRANTDTGGTSPWQEVSDRTLVGDTLNNVYGFTVSETTETSLTLAWSYDGSANTGFELEYLNDQGIWTQANPSIPAGDRTAVIPDLIAGLTVDLRLRAYDATVQSEWAYTQGTTSDPATSPFPVFIYVPTINIPEGYSDYQIDMNTYLSAANGTISNWSITNLTGVTINSTTGVVTFNISGPVTMVVTATNENGPGSTNQFQAVLYDAGAQTDLTQITGFYNYEHLPIDYLVDNEPNEFFNANDHHQCKADIPPADPQGTRHGYSYILPEDGEGWGRWGYDIRASGGGWKEMVSGGEMWVRMFVWWPPGQSYRTGIPWLKCMRIARFNPQAPGSDARGHSEFLWLTEAPHMFIYENEGCADIPGTGSSYHRSPGNPFPEGRWVALELYLKLSHGFDGVLGMWMNGNPGDFINTQTMAEDDDYAYCHRGLSNWNGGTGQGNPNGAYAYVDQHATAFRGFDRFGDYHDDTPHMAVDPITGLPFIGLATSSAIVRPPQ